MEANAKTFLGAVVFGAGFHLGWGIISLIVWAAAYAVGQQAPPMLR